MSKNQISFEEMGTTSQT